MAYTYFDIFALRFQDPIHQLRLAIPIQNIPNKETKDTKD